MASSKLMDSSNARNLEVRHRSSVTKSSMSELHNQPSAVAGGSNQSNLGHMSVNGYLQNLYGDGQGSESTLLDAEITLLDAAGAVTAISDNESGPVAAAIRRQESVPKGLKTVDDVWREIVAGRRECKQEVPDNEMMTLEDFLAKAGAVVEDDVKIEPAASPPALETEKLSGGFFAFDGVISPPSPFVGTSQQSVDGVVGFGDGVEVIGGRGKRRALLEPLDKAAQQRQKRMIKNRESAARSRERKQAYQVELESLAVKLEEENEQLLRDKEEQTKERFKQLMEKVIPVVEMRKPARVLKRVHSMNW